MNNLKRIIQRSRQSLLTGLWLAAKEEPISRTCLSTTISTTIAGEEATSQTQVQPLHPHNKLKEVLALTSSSSGRQRSTRTSLSWQKSQQEARAKARRRRDLRRRRRPVPLHSRTLTITRYRTLAAVLIVVPTLNSISHHRKCSTSQCHLQHLLPLLITTATLMEEENRLWE